MPDFYVARFGDRDERLRMVLIAKILIFMVGYVSSQFVGGGKAFAASFGTTPIWESCSRRLSYWPTPRWVASGGQP